MIREIILKMIDFISTGIWQIPPGRYSRTTSFFIRQLRIILLAAHKFGKDKCQLRASALTFYTLLAIVPVVAMAFGIAKGFGFEKLLQTELLDRFPGQEEVISKIIFFAQSLLETTKGGMIAGIGIVLLFWSAIKVLNNIESSFNDIWEIKKARPIGRKLSNYFAILFICPLLIILSSSMTVFITTQVTHIAARISLLGFLSPLISLLLKLLPYCLIWILFTFIYILIPSAQVNFSTGLIAGIVAGSVYQVCYWAYILFQVGVSRYNAIYGSFAAIPLFLVWLHFSWLILLMGAQLSFAYQNKEKSALAPDSLDISLHLRKIVALQIAHLLIKRFQNGEKPLTLKEICGLLDLPYHLVVQILNELVEGEILSETIHHEESELAYQPARDISTLSISHILNALEQRGGRSLDLPQTPALNTLSEAMQTFSDLIEKSPQNRLLRDL